MSTTRTMYARSAGNDLQEDWCQYVEHALQAETEPEFVARLDARYPRELNLTIEVMHEYTGKLVAHVRVFDAATVDTVT
jgi:hypothetical protein